MAIAGPCSRPGRGRPRRSPRLGLRDPVVAIGDFDRPHVHLSVHRALTVCDKRQELVRAAGQLAGLGIVYAGSGAA